jgi:hypothetical protein
MPPLLSNDGQQEHGANVKAHVPCIADMSNKKILAKQKTYLT